MIRTEGLTKVYAELEAVKDLNLHVRRGEIYGFLGPNGAGKTTTISMLLGINKPTDGKIYLFDKELKDNYFETKRRIGVVSEHLYFYEEMTAYEYLDFFADLYDVPDKKKRINELLETVNLRNRQGERLKGYSKGMKQKTAIARALLHDPELLILDEPVSSLDPYGIREVRDIIAKEHASGRTIFISSHILSEIERTCTRVGIMNKGRLVAEDDMANLKSKLATDVTLEVELQENKDEILPEIRQLEYVRNAELVGSTLEVRVNKENDYRASISEFLTQRGCIVLGLRIKEMTLEEAFVTLTDQNISLLAKEAGASGTE